MSDRANHQHCTKRFIDLANTLKDEGHEVKLVTAAIMAASSVYSTYAAAGNDGALEPSGVDKIVALFRQNLEHIQVQKKNRATEAAAATEAPTEATEAPTEATEAPSEATDAVPEVEVINFEQKSD